MSARSDIDLDGQRKRIYRYVERHGPVEPEAVAEAVGVDPESFQHHLSILKRDDLVEEGGGEGDRRIRAAVHRGEVVEHEEAGVSYEIRPARPRDLSGVVGVISEVAEDGTSIVAESVAEQLEYEDTLFRHTPAETRVVFVATVADEVVGWSHVRRPELSKLGGTAELTVGVLEAYRGHGIGSHLLQRGVEWAGVRNCRKVYNSLPATNETGIDFLQRNGWAIEAVRSDHYELDGGLVDEVMLARRLDRERARREG